MSKIRKHLTYANVMATIAVFVALSVGTAWAVGVERNAVRSKHVKNFRLNDQDVGEGTFVHFAADIGDVSANGCKSVELTGVNAGGDHLLLTPSRDDASIRLQYEMQYPSVGGTGAADIIVCNTTGDLIQDGTTHFNLLVFDA